MSEVTVIAHSQAKPGKEKELEQILRATVKETHKEPGCRLYALHRSADSPAAFLLVERWDSQADLERHFGTPHVKTLLAKMPDLLASEASIKTYASVPEGDAKKGIL